MKHIMPVLIAAVAILSAEAHYRVLGPDITASHFRTFAANDTEHYTNAVCNAEAFPFMKDRMPRFECPDADITRTWYFRWWTFRKHLRRTPEGWVITEFLPNVGWAGKFNTIVCPAGHHLREARWLADTSIASDDVRFWLCSTNSTHRWNYSSWLATGLREIVSVTGDRRLAASLLDEAIAYYRGWEKGREWRTYPSRKPYRMGADGTGLFTSNDDREGSEMSLGGCGYRPLMNAAMWSEAKAIAWAARLAGRENVVAEFEAKAAATEKGIKERIWDAEKSFFMVGGVRELNGYAPWYFGMELPKAFSRAWEQVDDEAGFAAPFGLTFPERRAKGFVISRTGHECQWNGPSWPFATSIALTGLANHLHAIGENDPDFNRRRASFCRLLHQYAAAQTRRLEDGRLVPWIDEDMDPFTGEWLARALLIEQRKGKKGYVPERGKDYNHSTFCDIVVTGLCGFAPREDGKMEVRPLAPPEWDWWCLDGVRYQGRDVTILYDKYGTRYGRGKGLVILPAENSKSGVALAALMACASLVASGAGNAEIRLEKPAMRWLWGGFGFHNSEATMTPMMTEEFRDQRVLKSFREISPTFSRLFAGYADWTKEAMDRFADYYDATFRRAGTTLYLVPGRMPTITEDFDADAYAEDVAIRLAYLIKERKCTKIRYYTASNELSVGPTGAWFKKNWGMYVTVMEALYRAFRRHGLDVGLMSSDASSYASLDTLDWSIRDLNEVTETYCWHIYSYSRPEGKRGRLAPGDPEFYNDLYEALTNYVRRCIAKDKRLSLGEWGVSAKKDWNGWQRMRNDGGTGFNHPGEEANVAAMTRVEMGLCAMNAGCVNAASWTFCDYPDPFVREDGDTAEEKGRYDVARFSGFGVDVRYNKWGLFRWDDETHDYSSYPDLYSMGYLVKLFRKGARVLQASSNDATLRIGAVTNPDGSCSIAVINWGEKKRARITSEHPIGKPLRRYVYESANPPFNAFNDLQPVLGTVTAAKDVVAVELPEKSITFLTTDYQDRTPPRVNGVHMEKNGVLAWAATEDANHVYYRVYRDGKQIASTVATSLNVGDAKGSYAVTSVDRWGNEGNHFAP